MTRRWRLLAAAVLAVFVVAGLWSAATDGRPAAPDEDVRAVAATLRCPTCIGESVADSTAPLAAGMREVIGDHLAQGRTPDEIRAWFTMRYGEEVLLDPPRRGAGWLLWLSPLAAAPFAVWFMLRNRGRVAWPAAGAAVLVVAAVAATAVVRGGLAAPEGDLDATSAASPVRVLEAAAALHPADAETRGALARALDRDGRVEEAVEHYAAVTRLAPADDRAHYLLAFALVRSDRPDEAKPVLQALVDRDPDYAEALLLLGTLRQDRDGAELLQRFLEVAPDHPAADDVAAELGESRQ